MSIFSGLKFDLVSFLAGTAVGGVSTWLIRKALKKLPSLKEPIDNQSRVMRMGNLEGMQKYMRQVMLLKSQHGHLAHHLFPLQDILIPTRFYTSPFTNLPSDQPGITTIADEIIPFLPDCSELRSAYPGNPISLVQAIENGMNIIITGQPGSGKSVALAEFAANIARDDPSVKRIASYFPIFVHIQDIDLSSSKMSDPLDRIVDSIKVHVSNLIQRKLPRFVKFMAYHEKLLLLIDGLDELPPASYESALKFLYSLNKRYPKARIITTAHYDFLDGLTTLGFSPIFISGWDRQTVDTFLRLWIDTWNRTQNSGSSTHNNLTMNPDMLVSWVTTEYPLHTPLEWTLKIWAVLAGDIRGSITTDDLESYIQRVTGSKIPHQKMEGLAYHYVKNKLDNLPANQVEKTLSRIKISSKAAEIETNIQEESSQEITVPRQKRKRKQKTVINRSAIYSTLQNSGLLIENDRMQTRFVHPIITGYLASYCLSAETPNQEIFEGTRWSTQNITCRYHTARDSTRTWIAELQNQDDLLFHRTLTISRWIPDIPGNFVSRTQILRHIAGMLQNPDIIFFNRARILSAFLSSNDPSRIILLKQLFSSRSPSIRVLAALGCGVIGDPRLLEDLLSLFQDQNTLVRLSASLAIAQLDYPDSLHHLEEIIMNTDEDMRRAAAEALALKGDKGQEILKKAMESEDILARRAAVFGLSLVRQDWVAGVLEKVSVEDGQWVVRNAASQALDAIHAPHSLTPAPLIKSTESPWLIAFAARNGMSVSPNIPPITILLLALSSGTQEEKISSLNYLRLYNMPEVVAGISKSITTAKDSSVVAASAYALWWMVASGVNIDTGTKSKSASGQQ